MFLHDPANSSEKLRYITLGGLGVLVVLGWVWWGFVGFGGVWLGLVGFRGHCGQVGGMNRFGTYMHTMYSLYWSLPYVGSKSTDMASHALAPRGCEIWGFR